MHIQTHVTFRKDIAKKDRKWEKLEEDTTVTPASNDTQFSEYKFTASGLTGFDAFQIKIVMKGSNQAFPPRIKDMRGIALAL